MNKTLILTGWSKTVYMTAAAAAIGRPSSSSGIRQKIVSRFSTDSGSK